MGRERPILFSSPMVRAILEGGKTQTRRIVSDVRGIGRVHDFGRSDTVGYEWQMRDRRELWNELRQADLIARCPYGQPGDRLWLRETFMVEPHPSDIGLTREHIPRTWDAAVAAAGTVHYAADHGAVIRADGRRWTPSIHMPRWASRITLEVTGVRVERLQAISQSDAEAEGVMCDMSARTFRDHFHALWERINGAGSWTANPWVWVIEFERVTS